MMTVQMRTGFPANSVFIVDGEDRVRHHTVLDSRVAFSVEEVARLVAAYRATDGGQVRLVVMVTVLLPLPQHLAMADWASEQDTVDNTVPAIQHYYGTKYGDEEHSCPGCPEGADSSDKEKKEPEKVSFSNSQGPMEEHNVGFNKGRGAGGSLQSDFPRRLPGVSGGNSV